MSEARTGHTTESAARRDCHLVLIVAAVHAAEGGGAELAGLGVHPHHGDTDQTSVLTLAPHNCRGALDTVTTAGTEYQSFVSHHCHILAADTTLAPDCVLWLD